ncbi:hypothetical protein AB0N99_30865 [Streptomyces sp. NPDC093272]|uniref:hypothetical protein n=1 Tax=Streptomyces sp. NPDC093272 TaxID=3154981 RepID=UPI00342551A2
MGTNYYVDSSSCSNACEHCTATERHHLGKNSIGWRFLFYADPAWPRPEAFADWVSRAASGRIIDESGDEHSLADLLNLIERNRDSGSHLELHPGCGARTAEIFQSCGHEFVAHEFS